MGYMAEIYWRNSFEMIRREVFTDKSFNVVRKAAEDWLKVNADAKVIETRITQYVSQCPTLPAQTIGTIPYLNEGSTDAELLRLRY